MQIFNTYCSFPSTANLQAVCEVGQLRHIHLLLHWNIPQGQAVQKEK